MLIEPYELDELSFAYRCYVYFRWHTYRRRSLAELDQLTCEQLQAVYPDIHLLELATADPEIGLMASLRPSESVSTAASKLKGAGSKTLRHLQGLTEPTRILAGGYFAATVGDNTSDELDGYLERQSSHHGYESQVNPPVWVQKWQLDEEDRAALQTAHAATVLHWHLVLATWNRQGVFTRPAAQELAEFWAQDESLGRIRLQKVSFVPDHVHIAVWAHPTVVPAELAVKLLNTSQELIASKYPHLLIEAKVPRMWKPSAYLGSYGDIRKANVRNYLRNWSSGQDDQDGQQT
jgi:REP element-mobilizing transposase RayT